MEKDFSLYLLSAIVQGTKKVTMQNRGFIFLLYLLLDFIGSFSQSNLKIFYPVNNQVLQQYNIRSLTTDCDGKLWLSTDNGLLSYDGNDVKIFKHDNNDPSSLSSDKREITLYDEIETCRLYLQLESMRFENKFNYTFNIDEALDMGHIMVPALIIQPFIENAIWHGLVPKDEGGKVYCIREEKGRGR